MYCEANRKQPCWKCAWKQAGNIRYESIWPRMGTLLWAIKTTAAAQTRSGAWPCTARISISGIRTPASSCNSIPRHPECLRGCREPAEAHRSDWYGSANPDDLVEL